MKALLLLLLLPASWLLTNPWAERGAISVAATGRVPVVVELFTSEGCSSCPAADEALRKLEAAQSVPGVEIIALGEHVDYWNRLGWKDGFSSPAYTARQRQYAQGFGSGAYTPQAVVNGQYEFVGSHVGDLTKAAASAAKSPRAVVALAAKGGAVQVRVTDVPSATAPTEVLLAITESGLASQVGRGENAGRLLRHASVVRQLTSLGRVGATGSFTARVAPALGVGWKRPNLRAVVLVQEVASRRIVGAAVTAL